jgi:hypothetical protein
VRVAVADAVTAVYVVVPEGRVTLLVAEVERVGRATVKLNETVEDFDGRVKVKVAVGVFVL